ncbi:hypothetical protein ORI98_04890 [Shewanella sp. ULN5]|uniref:hypothetical protein n=1 Tax=Shewanella sp. ULN5 TaxID=2994678 RepID=UPI00273E4942|nr:hypothetical protein [Shewanella sp. ULN5]MDP5145775.1 hypothetical protein [Shewanella sp. ULN5]
MDSLSNGYYYGFHSQYYRCPVATIRRSGESDFRTTKNRIRAPNKLSLKAIAQTYPHHGTRGQLKQQSYAIHTDSISPLLGRELALEQINNAIESWRKQQGELSAITAPFGAGLSHFINNIMHSQPTADSILWLSFYHAPLSSKEAIACLYSCFDINNDPQSITDAISLINNQPAKIIFIDDMHKLMLRRMGNYQALVTLATILMETRQKHCWIIGCETYVWQRLASQYQITHFFKTVVHLSYLNQPALNTLLSLHLAELGITLPAQSAVKTADDTEHLDPLEVELTAIEEHSKTLMTISQGHPKLALLVLKRSIESLTIKQLSTLSAKEMIEVDTQALNSLDEASLFALAEIYVHGGLTIENSSIIFNISIEKSSLTLEFLSRQGLLIPQYCEDDFVRHYYQITPALTKVVAVHLVNHNKLFSL